MPIRTLIVDDHELVRRGLSTYLMTEEGIEVVGEAANGKEALASIRKTRPDVVLMDLVMEEMDGVEATREAVQIHPGIRVIVLTSYINDDKVFPVLEAGAFSYLLKTARAEEIAAAIRSAHRGESTLEPKVSARLLKRVRKPQPLPHEDLTIREGEVLRLLGQAKTNQQIADILMIGIKTVKTHVSNILSKLGLEDRTQAAVYAVKHGLAEETDLRWNSPDRPSR
ncbi:response regulator transcription factor [Kroppenstedtia eburnea]|uniref:Two component transcriptional regulator, LuxR family n=1 Tax=Kroppenstedtia eburnea TaxID=714067 RepID=A0A1N7Q6D8_9BACL|nr:response regulator transcription factor [Kroppenstedtia eburnea]QKI83194.1 response regulator transcription factor [Kroppenstedtia eburnea]SIT18422.1 two component transcriptional regulator, LuxR family [Kroppenstedtia eburnea]